MGLRADRGRTARWGSPHDPTRQPKGSTTTASTSCRLSIWSPRVTSTTRAEFTSGSRARELRGFDHHSFGVAVSMDLGVETVDGPAGRRLAQGGDQSVDDRCYGSQGQGPGNRQSESAVLDPGLAHAGRVPREDVADGHNPIVESVGQCSLPDNGLVVAGFVQDHLDPAR